MIFKLYSVLWFLARSTRFYAGEHTIKLTLSDRASLAEVIFIIGVFGKRRSLFVTGSFKTKTGLDG